MAEAGLQLAQDATFYILKDITHVVARSPLIRILVNICYPLTDGSIVNFKLILLLVLLMLPFLVVEDHQELDFLQ